MKFRTLGLFSLLFLLFTVWGIGCMPYHRGAVLTIGFHDDRWHYEHDHDDHWRSSHPWHEKHHDHDEHHDRDDHHDNDDR